MKSLLRFQPDILIRALVAAAIIASFLPVRGQTADGLELVTQISVALLFYLHGARLLPQTVFAGFANWRLHLTILACSFVIFPVLAIPIGWLMPSVLSPEIYAGFIFLSILPSTIQSSIAFTSISGGNVAAAVCAASASNMLGVALTPLLAALLLQKEGGVDPHAIESIMLQLLAPFALGQLTQRWVGDWVRAHRKLLGFVERGSIVSVAYLAFSDAVVGGIWNQLQMRDLLGMLITVAALLAAVLFLTRFVGRNLGFSREDQIAIMFCGSKKSMGSGLPMANIIFAGQALGLIVLPMMLYHQLQLIVCAIIAQRYADRHKAAYPDRAVKETAEAR